MAKNQQQKKKNKNKNKKKLTNIMLLLVVCFRKDKIGLLNYSIDVENV
jgi:cell division protein FtsB